MPLGATYQGVCRAIEADDRQPDDARQRELCNRGYARGVCPCFPPDAPADAVRFSVLAPVRGEEPGQNSSEVPGEEPGHVRLRWVQERDHAPIEHGALTCRSGLIEGASGLLAAQALAFWNGTRGRAARRAGV